MFDIRAHDDTPAAPGDLEVVQRFMNLHEHRPGDPEALPPSSHMVRAFLVEHGHLDPRSGFGEQDLAAALALQGALHARVRANAGARTPEPDVRAIDRIARDAGLQPSFGADRPRLVPSASGVLGALGRLVAIAFHADLDGSWSFLKECAGQDCTAVFFDRSKNHSGRWCSMSSCGNRAKVRAWRERQRTGSRA